MNTHIVSIILISALACVLNIQLKAQDLEPRFLSPIPTGGNFAIASYGYSYGNILLDNTLPIEDLNASINSIVMAYARSFKLFHKLAKFDVVIPYAIGNYEAIFNSVDTSASKHGFGDPLFRISMILIGTDPLSPVDYFKQEQKKFNLGIFNYCLCYYWLQPWCGEPVLSPVILGYRTSLSKRSVTSSADY